MSKNANCCVNCKEFISIDDYINNILYNNEQFINSEICESYKDMVESK